MADRTVDIDLIARDKTSRAFGSASRSASKAEGSLKRTGKAFAKFGLIAGGAVVAGVGAAGYAMNKFVEAGRESNKVAAVTASQIEATGSAANLTAKQISDLATATSQKTGIDDEAIQANENLLLSFRNVRDEAGKGNKVFSRTTLLAQDMATVLGTDASGATMQLGKALNDPIKGLTKLARSGVTFTAQQVKQVTALQNSGHTLEAQKIILREVGKEFGGAATAAATPMDKLKVTLGNVAETIGQAVIPYLDKGATALNDLIAGFQSGTGPGGKLQQVLRQIGDGAKTVLPVLQQIGTFIMGTVVPAIGNLIRVVGPPLIAALQAGFGFWKTNVLPILVEIYTFIAEKVVPVLAGILKSALEGVRDGFANFSAAIDRNRPAIEGFLGVIKVLAEFLVTKVLPIVGPILKAAFTILGGVLSVVADKVSLLWKAFKFLATIVLTAFGTIIHGAAKAFGWIPGIGGKLKKADKAFQDFKDKALGALNGIGDKGYNLGKDFADGLAAGIRENSGAAVAAAQGVANRVAAGYAAQQQSSSPSKVAIKLGQDFSHGIGVGLAGPSAPVVAAKGLAASVTATVASTPSGGATTSTVRLHPESVRDVASLLLAGIRGSAVRGDLLSRGG